MYTALFEYPVWNLHYYGEISDRKSYVLKRNNSLLNIYMKIAHRTIKNMNIIVISVT